MVAQAPGSGNSGQGNQGGSGSPGGSSGQGNSNQGSTTTTSSQSQQSQSLTTTNPFAASTTTASPTSTSTSTSKSGVQKGVIIGGVVGGLAALLVLALIAIWCLQRRKKRQLAAKNGTAQPVTYSGLNSAFAGVPFRNSQQNLSPQQTQSLLPGAAQYSQHDSTHSSNPGLGIRGGASSIPMTSSADTDLFLPTYTESQASVHSSPVIGQLHAPQYSPIDANVSPLSSRAPTNLHNISPQTTGAPTMHNISPQTTGGPSMLARDTMGFPVDQDFEMIRLTEPVPHIPVPIVAPIPRHPLVHQDSLERQVRAGMVTSPSPVPSTLEPVNPARLRILSQGTSRESPILGNDPTHVRILPQGTGSSIGVSASGLGGGLNRNDTQRTVSSVSSMGQSIISDGALERMGIGAGVNPTPKPAPYPH